MQTPIATTMVDSSHCPFCVLGPSEIVLAENIDARVVCDIRPMCKGHMLVLSRNHIPSVADLSPEEVSSFRIMEGEALRRLSSVLGEAGSYEHGRASLCRFHPNLSRYRGAHAHAHIVPVEHDITAGIAQDLRRPDRSRYLTATLHRSGRRRVVFLHDSIPSHVVRVALQPVLDGRGLWIPLNLEPEVYERKMLETATTWYAAPSCSFVTIEIDNETPALIEEQLTTMSHRLTSGVEVSVLSRGMRAANPEITLELNWRDLQVDDVYRFLERSLPMHSTSTEDYHG